MLNLPTNIRIVDIIKLVNGPAKARIAFLILIELAFFTFVLYSSGSTLKLICSPTGDNFISSGTNFKIKPAIKCPNS